MDRKRLRIVLIEKDLRLVDLHRETGISYNRLLRIVNGYAPARDMEIDSIARTLGLTTSELRAHEGDVS